MQQGRASRAGSATARFVLLTDQPRPTGRAGAQPEPQQVTWVLMAANNRSLGRAGRMFGSVESCLADTGELTAGLARATSSVVFHDRQPAVPSHWSWMVHLDAVPRAVSVARYHRRLECEGSLRRFLAAAEAASAGTPAVFRLGARLRAAQA